MFTALHSRSPGGAPPISRTIQDVTCFMEASTLLETTSHQVWYGLGAAEFEKLPLRVWDKLSH